VTRQHTALAVAGAAGGAALIWALGRPSTSGNGTVAGTVDCSMPDGSAETCPSIAVLELVDAAGVHVPVPLDRTDQTAVFSVTVHAGVWTVVGNGTPISDPNGQPLTVSVVAGTTTLLHLTAIPRGPT